MSDNHQELKALKEQIKKFIKQDTPEIFALTGTWGVGKTFALKNVIDEFKKENDTKKYLDDYAYVSLFGLKEIKDIESKIVVSLTKEEINDLSQKQTSKKQSICESIEYYFKKSLKWIKNFIIYIKNFIKSFSDTHFNKIRFFTGLAELIFINRMIKNKIICFDDFERTSIDTQELLGFLQDLKEERNCKIILIYNQEKLDNRKKDFDRYREKVIDKHFDYRTHLRINCVKI